MSTQDEEIRFSTMVEEEDTPQYQEMLAEIGNDVHRFVEVSAYIVIAIKEAMESKHLSQKELALTLGETEAEISKWLGGAHNFTLRSIAKLEAALGCELLSVNVSGSIPAETAPPASKPYPLEDTAPNLLAADDNVEYKRKKP